jgi:hypothetical protein
MRLSEVAPEGGRGGEGGEGGGVADPRRTIVFRDKLSLLPIKG